jgi:protein-tyrosine phosphatase
VIDTHCHLLPGLDDGPRSPSRALALARALAADGVTHVVCTPHFSRRYPTRVDAALDALATLQDSLATGGIRLGLSLGAEVSSTFAAVGELEDLRARTIARRFVLVELERDVAETVFDALLARLAEARLVPVLGHPERCAFVQRNPATLDPAIAAGALVQVVAPSVVAGPESRSAAAAWRLLDSGRVDLLASDAHDTERRPPKLAAAVHALARRYGDDVGRQLSETAPAALLAGQHPRK